MLLDGFGEPMSDLRGNRSMQRVVPQHFLGGGKFESSWRLRGISLQPSTLQLIEKYLGFDLLTTRLRVEQVPRLFGRVSLHEVCGHVVGGAERRADCVAAARREVKA